MRTHNFYTSLCQNFPVESGLGRCNKKQHNPCPKLKHNIDSNWNKGNPQRKKPSYRGQVSSATFVQGKAWIPEGFALEEPRSCKMLVTAPILHSDKPRGRAGIIKAFCNIGSRHHCGDNAWWEWMLSKWQCAVQMQTLEIWWNIKLIALIERYSRQQVTHDKSEFWQPGVLCWRNPGLVKG